MDRVDDTQCRSVTVLDYAEENRSPTVLSHDVLLYQPAVVNLADVLYEYGCPVRHLDRNIVEIIDGRGGRVGLNRILLVTNFCGAGGKRQILSIDRIHYVKRGQPLGEQLRRIEINHDLAIFSARRRRKRDPRYRGQLLADSIDAVVIELLLAERIGTQAYLKHRDARRIELHHRRGLDSRRQRRADAVGRRHNLRYGEVKIDVWLEENLLHREPGQGLSLDVLDAVDARAD